MYFYACVYAFMSFICLKVSGGFSRKCSPAALLPVIVVLLITSFCSFLIPLSRCTGLSLEFLILQFKVHPVAQHLVLPQVAMEPHLHTVAHHSTHKHSQHTAATQATHLLQQPPHIQDMAEAIRKLVLMVPIHRHQQLLMAVRHPTVVLVLEDMIPMVPKGSRHTGAQVDMGAKVHSPALSQQLVAVVSGRSSQIMKADHTTTTRLQGSASGTAQPTCEAAQPRLQPQTLLQQDLSSSQHRSGNADYSCAWHPRERVVLPVVDYLPQLDLSVQAVLDACSGMQCLAAMLGVRCLLQVCQMPECLVRCRIEVLDA